MTIKWKFWQQKYSVCEECGVHFEPVTGYLSRWGNLCAEHRKPVKERDEKKSAVMAWADANWVKLSKQMDAERYELEKAQLDMMKMRNEASRQAAYANFAVQQQSPNFGNSLGACGGIAGGLK